MHEDQYAHFRSGGTILMLDKQQFYYSRKIFP